MSPSESAESESEGPLSAIGTGGAGRVIVKGIAKVIGRLVVRTELEKSAWRSRGYAGPWEWSESYYRRLPSYVPEIAWLSNYPYHK